MKQTITSQLESFSNKYGWVITFATRNMRLLLLVLFAALSGYLVLRVSSLVSSNGEIPPTAQVSLEKTPDKEVISLFSELSTKEITLQSSFEENRQNPF